MLVVMVISVFVIEFLLIHSTSRSSFGSEIAHKLLPRDVLNAVFVTALLGLNKPWLFLFSIVGIAFFWITWLLRILRRSDGGQVLLRWKPSRHFRAIAFIFLAGSILIILSFISHPLKVDDLSYVAVGVLFISFIPFRYFEKEAYITDNGIETGRDYIRWVQIESYQWPASDEEVIQVFFKTSRRLPIINFVQLDVPYEMKDAVDETLLRKVLHVPATPEVHA